ncbi:MAG: uroporphyrinogen decarboxylase family protein [Candidatus Sigynarchaeota archaeon]
MLLDYLPLIVPINFSFSANWYFKQSNGRIRYTKDVLLDDPLLKARLALEGAHLRHDFLPEMFPDPSSTRPSVNLGIGLATIPHFVYGAIAKYFTYQEPWTEVLVKPGENPLDVVTAMDESRLEDLYAPLANQKDALLRQYSPKEISIGPPDQQGPMNLLFRLVGERIFHYMLKKKDIAHRLFENITTTFINSHRYFRQLLHGIRPGKKMPFNVAECCSYLESPALVEEFNLKYDTRCAEELGPMGLHSCGQSTHNLEAFSKFKIIWAEFGFGTDLEKARKLLVQEGIGPVSFSCRINPKRLLSLQPADIEKDVEYILGAVKGGPASIASVGVDHGTPRENLLAAMNRVKRYIDEKAELEAC